MRILITGASGLLGINLALLASKDHEVVGGVNSRMIRTDRFEVRQVDLTEVGAVTNLIGEVKPDWVVHCVAVASIDESEKQPELAQRLNAELPGEVAAAAKEVGAQLAHISTDAVFDGIRGNFTEEDETNPLNVYAKTKLAGEQAVLEVYPEAAVVRVNFFGWSIGGRRSLAEFFYNNLQEGKPMKGFTDSLFCSMLVNDLSGVLLGMLEKELSGVYHAVSPEAMSKYDFGVGIAEKFGFDPGLIEPISVGDAGLAATRSPNLTLRTDKLQEALGHKLPTISDGLTRFYGLYEAGYPEELKKLLRN